MEAECDLGTAIAIVRGTAGRSLEAQFASARRKASKAASNVVTVNAVSASASISATGSTFFSI